MKKREQKLEMPLIAVDIVIFTIVDNDLKVLLVKRGNQPFKNQWALPGGFVLKNETLEKAAIRELKEETGIENVHLKQLHTFGDPKRDPRGRIISVTYFALVNRKLQLKPKSDAVAVDWFSVKKLPFLAFDHKKIIRYALKNRK